MTATLGWRLHDDGSFDLVTPAASLRGCRPAIDGVPLRTLSVQVTATNTGGSITYRLADSGTLSITLAGVNDHEWSLQCQVEGIHPPQWIHPLHGATIDGADRLFRTGLGFSGPTNFVDIKPKRSPFVFESYLITALTQGQGQPALAWAALEHGRFVHRTDVYNRIRRDRFRNREIADGSTMLETGFGTEGIATADGRWHLPELRLVYATNSWQACQLTAQRVAEACQARTASRKHLPSSYHWCSWYDRGAHFSREQLDSFLSAAKGRGEVLSAVQIDAGYARHGSWLDFNSLWPGGMEGAFKAIRDAGYVPGIWIAPFMVSNRSWIAQEHPDWLLTDRQGQRIIEWRHYNHAAEEEHYVLDTSHPDAFEHVRMLFQTFRRWGAGFFKTDFMDWGFKDSSKVRRHTQETGAAHYRRVLAMIRDAIGHDTNWLACISYYAPFVGLCDSMRVSADTACNWPAANHEAIDTPEGGLPNVIDESYYTQFFNGILWHNDPDATYLRHWHIHLNDDEIKAQALLAGILGGSVNTSDKLHQLTPERYALWRFIRPGSEPTAAWCPHWDRTDHQLRVIVRRYARQRGWGVLALNPRADRTLVENLNLHELTHRACSQAQVYTWQPGLQGGQVEAVGPLSQWWAQVAPHSACLWYVSEDGSPPPADLTLGGYLWAK